MYNRCNYVFFFSHYSIALARSCAVLVLEQVLNPHQNIKVCYCQEAGV